MTHVACAEHLVSVSQAHLLEAMTLVPPPHIQSAVEHAAVLEPWAQSCVVGVFTGSCCTCKRLGGAARLLVCGIPRSSAGLEHALLSSTFASAGLVLICDLRCVVDRLCMWTGFRLCFPASVGVVDFFECTCGRCVHIACLADCALRWCGSAFSGDWVSTRTYSAA